MTTTSLLTLPRSARRGASLFSRLGWTAAIITAVVALGAILAPLISPYPPDYVDLQNVLAWPSFAHPLGTDALGRDTLSRVLVGARTSLLGPLIVVVASTIVGALLGLLAGWQGGWTDRILSRIFDLMFSFPALLLAILAVALLGKGLTGPIIAMTIAYVPYVARLTRNLILAERNRPYVAAYRVLGFGAPWIALRRVLPNIFPTVGAQSTLNFGYVLADLAALSFIGLGVQAPTADWGSMINESRSALLLGQPLPALIPAALVVIVVVAINILGEELSDRIGGSLS